jgi:hypothetical protein
MGSDVWSPRARPAASASEDWAMGIGPGSAPMNVRVGLAAAFVVFATYLGVAIGVDFPRSAFGFQSDEATYYMMGHSLAQDGDLAYRRDDLERVWKEFPAGPTGVFLKRGRALDLKRVAGWLPAHIDSIPDPDAGRLYYGKSFIYPLVAAPFVRAFGTNGFLVLHAALLGLTVFAAFLFVNARSSAPVALAVAGGYVLGSVASVYFVWITPELFNLALVVLAYFCWTFKEVSRFVALPRGLRWLTGGASDSVAMILLGIVTFSKPSNVLLAGPPLLWMAWNGRWRRAVTGGLFFALVVGGFFALNMAITGEWNFQGGERVTCYAGFPFQRPGMDLSACMDRRTDRVLTEVIFNWPVFWKILGANLVYFFVGRHSGLVPYFFPAVFAMMGFLAARRRRQPWQWLVLLAGCAEILLLVVWIPYNYFGGGGVVGNRYFMNTYGIFLFLLPPVASLVTALLPWIVGALFTAQLTLNPFYSSFNPASHTKQGIVRLLPVELTLVNDLPINTSISRVRVPFGEKERFQIYFLDDNAYGREGNNFWVKGRSKAEFLVKSARPLRALLLTLSGVLVPDEIVVRGPRFNQTLTLGPDQARSVLIPLGDGFPYQGTRVWVISVSSREGFVPMFHDPESQDHRYLGVLVTPDVQ